MSTSTAAEELLATIAQRRTFLECVLQQEGPRTKQTLLSELELTRSPIEKIIRNLKEMALLDVGPNGVTPTLLATLAYDKFQIYCQQIAAIGEPDGPWPTKAQQQEVMSLVAARCDVLECVWTTPHDKRDLVDALDASRSTVDRAVRELEVVALIEWSSDGYTTTPAGRQATTQYRTTVQTLSDILAAQDVLTALPWDCPIGSALFVDADVEYSADTVPYHLPTSIRNQIFAGDRVSICLPKLATPLLLDCCHRGVVHHDSTLEILTSPALFDSLTSDFPGPLADIASSDACTVAVTATIDALLPFGLVLSESESTTSISVIAYDDQGTIHGTIHNDTDAAIRWATTCYEQIRGGMTNVTDELRTLTPVDTARETMALSGRNDGARVKWEDEGFVRLTPSYFAQRAPAEPLTGWRTGFDLVDIHAGYAIDREREHDGTCHNLTTDLTTRLTENTNLAVLGPPGSGKSTVCKSVACRWYEQGLGPVFYRESGHGTSFTSPAVLENHLRATDGHVLVVVEDAVRAEANAVFRLMKAFRGSETVTFLLDAREGEWSDSGAFPIDAGLDAYRTETIETVSMPPLDDTEAKRFVQQFEQTTDNELDDTTEQLLRESWTDDPNVQGQDESRPAAVLLLLHRLSMYVDPLIGDTTNISTRLIEDIQRAYETFQQAGDLVLNVAVLVNLLNAAGLSVSSALADKEKPREIESVRAALSVLEGRVIFEREDESDVVLYRTIHEEWSALFLDHLLEVDTEYAASIRVGQCVTALLSLADEPERRNRIIAAFRHTAPAIKRIADAPGEWADMTIKRLFYLGQIRPGLAPLFGTTGDSSIDLPDACSQTVTVKCTLWRALMAKRARDFDSAEHEYECLATLADDVEATDPDWAATLRRSRRCPRSRAASRTDRAS